ncbi:MAG: dehydrogenase [Lentisphaerae bacterium RIFOXYB12_FULL_65_16]|nr:MAG: dehydrogenase [Lentisphaerae bacterium RIFOXYA12_64_32]OGV90780.1 MAG: dehydrogenase [Lentisphaerae bacterium RIFOXYB12_FULL_65_16]
MKRFKSPAEVKVGVVGYGGAFNMGRHHLNEMKRAGMTPAAVAEIDPERLKVATTDFPGIQTFASLPEMLKKSDVNLMAIITPHNTHAKLALQAINAGRHIVCEKPFAITTAECDAMIAAAKKKGVVVSTYHNRHWDGTILGAMKQVQAGLIGEVFRVEAHMGGYNLPREWWRSSKSISGGIMYDWGVHLLEYSLQILDSEIDEVSGFAKNGFWAPQTKWKNDTNEDEGFATVRFKNGKWLTLCISSLESNPKRSFVEVTGTKGSLIMDWAFNEVITHDGTTVISTKYKNPDAEGWKLYQNIADHLVKGEKLIIPGEWARRPIHILDLACRSAKLGKALKAKYR